MKYTNKLNLPEAFVKSLKDDGFASKPDGTRFSVTELLKGSTEIVLCERHWGDIETDASMNVWQLLGSAVHSILESYEDGNMHEQRVGYTGKSSDGTDIEVIGRVDSYNLTTKVLYDWKTASVWKVQFKSFEDWDLQGMMYAWLMKENSIECNKVSFIALLKDWSASKARLSKEYPQTPVITHEIEVTDELIAKAKKFAIDKIDAILNARKLLDGQLPACSKEETWESGEKWALMKKGRKSAVKLYDTEDEANKALESSGSGFFIEHRDGVRRKCLDYCPCKEYCVFYQSFKLVTESNIIKSAEKGA